MFLLFPETIEHYYKYFRMEEPTAEDINKLKDADPRYKSRKQNCDHRGQVFCISCNFGHGQKLPLNVKYPRISRFYEKVQRDHEWSLFWMGVYNGLFIVPDIPDEGQFIIPGVNIQDYDPVIEFLHSSQYKQLLKTFNMMYNRLSVSGSGTTYNERNTEDFSYDDNIVKYGK